ncbi:MAG: hypothetical protein AAF311_06035 [Pseudomonadota bacterium]
MLDHQRYILAKDCALQPLDRSGALPQWAVGKEVVLSRALCAFNRIKLNGDLSATKRRQSAELQARISTPFEDPALFLILTDGHALAWTWDRVAFEKRTGLPARLGLPETVLHPPQDGFALKTCLDGYEGQCWSDGHLHHSRWWPKMPSPGEWRLFQSSVDDRTVPHIALPQPLPPTDPGHGNAATGNASSFRSRLAELRAPMVAALCALVVLPVLSYLIVGALTLSLSNADLRQKVASLETELGAKREAAMRLGQARATLADYAAQMRRASPLLPLSAILEKVAETDGQIENARLIDGLVEVTFVTQQTIDTVAWVRALEADPSLSGVEISSTVRPGERVVTARVDEAAMFATQGQGEES